MKLALLNSSYYSENKTAIKAAVDPAIGNFKPIVGDGGMILCRGVDAEAIGAITYAIPAKEKDEDDMAYHARTFGLTTAAFAKTKGRAPEECMQFNDERLIHNCRGMKDKGWEIPANPDL